MVTKQKLARSAVCTALLLMMAVGSAAAISPEPTTDLSAPVGVRATGMGGAYTAIASDVTALFYNPAGIGKKFMDVTVSGSSTDPAALKSVAIIASEKPNADELAALSNVVDLSGFAGASLGPFAVAAVGSGDFEKSTDTKWKATTTAEAIGGLGFRIARAPLGAGDLRIGVTASAIECAEVEYEILGDEVSSTYERTGKGFRLSVGALANITPWVSLGVTAKNLAGEIEWDGENTEKLETLYTGGIAVKVPFLGIVLAADADDKNNVRYGAETNLLFNLLSLRVGQSKSANDVVTTTAGASLNLGPVSAGVSVASVDKENVDRVLAEASIRF